MSDVTPGAPDHGTSSPPAGDAGNGVNGRIHDRAGRNGGDHRAADDPRRPARQHLGPGLDDQRLQPGLRGTGLDRYRAGRPVRPPPGLSGRGGAVHTRLGRRRAQPSVASLIAARAALGASGEIATPLSLVLISEAYPLSRRGMVVRAWGAITGIAVGARAGGGRRDRAGPGVAVGVLAERAGRARAGGHRQTGAGGKPRPGPAAGSGRLALATGAVGVRVRRRAAARPPGKPKPV